MSKKATIVGTRYPNQQIVPYAKQATANCVSSNCIISTGDAIGIDRIASSTTRFINKKHPVLIFSAKTPDYEWRNNWTHYLDQMDNVDLAYAIAEYIHPAWDKCDDFAKSLHARNAYQVMGMALVDPTDITIAFAEVADNVTGGTRTAYTLSKLLGLPTFNLYYYKHQIDRTLWQKIFGNGHQILWDNVEQFRKPVDEAFAKFLLEKTKDDEKLQNTLKLVYSI